ncbi:MAG: Vitamin B12 transporter BtuB [Elusimicrobia bacterium]|nr:Vitamin B12 transporter BtuB [Elusimicrobiota bacterium]
MFSKWKKPQKQCVAAVALLLSVVFLQTSVIAGDEQPAPVNSEATGVQEFDQPAEMDEVVVQGDLVDRLIKKGQLKSSIVKTEVINESDISGKQANSLSEAVQNEPGIDNVVGCSICGMRRIQINGLKGEYTTLLMDGVPLNSTVSSYYGFDALATAGVSSIEIARGSGASLIAPEAIGGVINVVSKRPTSNSLFFDVAGGNAGYRALSIVGTGVSADRLTGATGAAQFNERGQWDEDGNGVNEAPEVKSQTGLVRFSKDLNDRNHLDIRLMDLKSHTFGGPTENAEFKAVLQTGGGGLKFEDNDVRKAYIGDPSATLETVDTERTEGVVRWTNAASDKLNLAATVAGALQTQDSFYEGADYYNKNKTFFSDVRGNYSIGCSHLLTLGADVKDETLRAESFYFFDQLGRDKDDFDFLGTGAYLQDVWTPSLNTEISAAVRLDTIKVDFKGETDTKNEIDETLASPRIHVKLGHGPLLSSRFSFGRGYRAPLTFFESEHGLLDEGFDVKITDLEKSKAAGYALSLDSNRWTGTASYAYTEVENLSYVNTNDFSVPTLVNSQGRVNVKTADIVVGYQLTPTFNIAASYENFDYQDKYKSLLAVAAVEDRARLMLGYDNDKAGLIGDLTLVWTGSRDLRPYGYGDRYNVYDPNAMTAFAPKGTDAPSFVTVDLKVSKTFRNDLTIYAGAKNLFDYTQTSKESPLFFDAQGGYDVVHIWGPLRGREVYAGVQMKFEPRL